MTEQMHEFLRALHPNEKTYRDLRAISSNRQTVRQFNFRVDDVAHVDDFLTAKFTEGLNKFVGVAARAHANGGQLRDCADLHALFADIDFKAGITREEALALLNEFRFRPSFIFHTGGGLHVYWLLTNPLDLQQVAPKVKALLRKLAERVRGDMGAATPERILRVPGTLNYKYDPPMPVTVLEFAPDRRYAVEDFEAELGPLDSAPDAPPASPIAHNVPVDDRITRAKSWLSKHEAAISGKGGNQHTYNTACAVVIGHDLSKEQAFAAMQEWNARCEPPWSPEELKTLIENAEQYGDKSTRGGRLVKRPRFHIYTEEALLARPAAPFLAKGLLVDGSLTALVSPPDIGKTFVALDLLLSIAAQQPSWLGHKLLRHGPVLYVMGEGAGRFKLRYLAWKQVHNVANGVPFYWMDQPVPLRDEKAMREFLLLAEPLAPTAIVFDTLSRCLTGADENSQADMSEAMAACDEVRARTGSWVGLLHHTKKDGTQERGSSVLRAAVDTVLFLSEDEEQRGLLTLRCDRQKDAEPFAPIKVERRVIQLAGLVDEDGTPETSCVIRLATEEDVARLADKTTQRDIQIVEYVRKHRNCSKNDVINGLGGNKGSMLKAIKRLIEKKSVVVGEKGRLHVSDLYEGDDVSVPF